MTTVAGVPTQLALMLRDPEFDSFDLSSRAVHHRGRRTGHPGLAEEARRRFGAALATRYSCTEAGIGLGTAFDDPDEDAIVSVGRPHASVDLAVLDADDRAGSAGRDRRGVPALPRGDVGLLARSRADRRRVHRATGSCARATSAGSTTAAGSASSVAARRCTCAADTTCIPVEIESVLSTHPGVAAVAIVPRADDVMGEIGVAVVVAARSGERPPTLAELRDVRAPHIAAYKLPEALIVRRRASAHRGREGRPPCVGRRAERPRQPDGPRRQEARMELEFTTDQDELRDSIRAVLGKESPVALARAGRRTTASGPTRCGRR